MTKSSKGQNKALDLDRVAANGLLSRRHLLSAALGGAGLAMARPVIGQEPGIKLEIPAWSKTLGRVPARTAAVLHMPNWNGSRDLAIRFTRAEAHPVLPCSTCRAPLHRTVCISNAIMPAFRQ